MRRADALCALWRSTSRTGCRSMPGYSLRKARPCAAAGGLRRPLSSAMREFFPLTVITRVSCYKRTPYSEDVLMKNAQRRYDISDAAWALPEPHPPGQAGQRDDKRYQPGYQHEKWGTARWRFIRRRDERIWKKSLEILIDEPDFERLTIDAGHRKVRPRAAGSRGGNQGMGRAKGCPTVKYTWSRMRMTCRSGLLWRRAPRRIVRAGTGLDWRIVAATQADSLTMRRNPAARLLFRPERTARINEIR